MNLLAISNKLNTFFPELSWSICTDLKLGVLACNSFFRLAKEQKQSPQVIAQSYQNKIQAFLDQEKIELVAVVAGNYLNLDFNDKTINAIYKSSDTIFRLNKLKKTLILDYFNPNVGKNAHIGHIRSSNLGESLRRILSQKYEKVISNNHLGDWGVQFSLMIWGLFNFSDLKLDFQKPDFETDSAKDSIDKFYKIYVEVNKLAETDATIGQKAREIQLELELEMVDYQQNLANPDSLLSLWQKIIVISQKQYKDIEVYLNLNQNLSFLENKQLISNQSFNLINSKKLAWELNMYHQQSQFDLVLGESFYVNFFPEIQYLASQGIFETDGKAIFIDLEAQNLGRCYLVSSTGYSTYIFRDVVARFVWSGVFASNLMLSFADNRQSHSFAQAFAVIEKIISSKVYEVRKFGWLNKIQTQRAVKILSSSESVKHVAFGFMSLPEGVMSTRKGKILAFNDIQKQLEEKAYEVISQKDITSPTPDLVKKITVATLKWLDLHRDRDADIVFDIQKVLQFEGNTGVYQLYTLARINSIFEKNQIHNNKIETSCYNQEEVEIIKHIATLPLVLETVSQTYKPHILTNFLYDLATRFNSWYAKYSVLNEPNFDRKNALLHFCVLIKKTLGYGLDLLGIESVDKI